MLAKDLKIATLAAQRNIIFGVVENAIKTSNTAAISMTYKGYIFPEVKEKLITEGFDILTIDDPSEIAKNGQIINLITISESIVLNESEMKESYCMAEKIADRIRAAKAEE